MVPGVFGGYVPSGLNDAGEMIISDGVRRLAGAKGFTFEPRGEFSLKGSTFRSAWGGLLMR